MRDTGGIEIPPSLFFIVWMWEDINFLFFLSIIFGLQRMTILMDDNNDTQAKIKVQLKELKRLKYGYLSFILIVLILEYADDYGIQAYFTFTTWFAWTNVILKLLTFFLRLFVHIKLINMALQFQKLLRIYGHVKGYRAEAVFISAYLFFCGNFVYWYIFRPILVLLINTTEFTCSSADKFLIMIFAWWQRLAMPLSAQIVFSCLIW